MSPIVTVLRRKRAGGGSSSASRSPSRRGKKGGFGARHFDATSRSPIAPPRVSRVVKRDAPGRAALGAVEGLAIEPGREQILGIDRGGDVLDFVGGRADGLRARGASLLLTPPRRGRGCAKLGGERGTEGRHRVSTLRHACGGRVRCPTRCVAPGTAARRADAAVIFKSKWSAAEMLRNPSIRLVETIHLQLWISGDRRFFGGHRRSKSSTAPAQTERRRRHAPRFSRSSPWARSRRCHSRTHLSRPHAPRKHGLRHRRSRLPHRPRRHARQPQGDQAPHEDAAQEGARRASCASG